MNNSFFKKIKSLQNSGKIIFSGIFFAVLFFVVSYIISPFFVVEYVQSAPAYKMVVIDSAEANSKFTATHIDTPKPLKAIYMSSWVAGTPSLRKKLVKLIEETELNAVIIDIKDDTGKISFKVEDEYLQKIGSSVNRIPDIVEFIDLLHLKNIYVIGRLSVFQDPYMAHKYPELAVKRKSDGGVWRDRKGISWLDAGAEDVWKYVVAIARESYNKGFDEINFDYIRFPSDGNTIDISYPFSNEKIKADLVLGKAEILRSFFMFVKESFLNEKIVLSADFFGMTTTNSDDLSIGQILEYALPYFDFVSPMVYPSHYPNNFNGVFKSKSLSIWGGKVFNG